ncbi:uncharacterized protein LOC129588362 [Paramacrobiotus metropolitanus]|uniref:uncharacterized protein LOC129588362 n=1 Tax=Paramacrobiotus metropolitanus TaxID=2943436 RepID=UPI00244642DC|nr:uncharacterized protein LOC129588362 [Paramacrobiotus metropolitanus]
MADNAQMEMMAAMMRLKNEVDEKRKTTPKSELKCINCHHHPTVFHNENARKEFEEISQICGACWEVITLEPDATKSDIEAAENILKLQNRTFHYKPRGWTCLTCKKRLNHQFMQDKCDCISS